MTRNIVPDGFILIPEDVWTERLSSSSTAALLSELSRRDLVPEELAAMGEVLAEHGRAVIDGIPAPEASYCDEDCLILGRLPDQSRFCIGGFSCAEKHYYPIPGPRCPWTRNQARLERMRKEGKDD